MNEKRIFSLCTYFIDFFFCARINLGIFFHCVHHIMFVFVFFSKFEIVQFSVIRSKLLLIIIMYNVVIPSSHIA
jgi:hypothetical protein